MPVDAGRSPTDSDGDPGSCDHERALPLFDNGDHLYPDDIGTQAMADAVEIDSLSCDRDTGRTRRGAGPGGERPRGGSARAVHG
jgi:hypothetical protein